MLLYSIQPSSVLINLNERKRIYNDGTHFDECILNAYLSKYDWLVGQLDNHRIPRNKDKAKYPFWAWYKYSENRKKPDLRHAGLAPKGTECVLLELEIPDKDVLLSNFDEWNCILNDYPVFDEENWDVMYNKYKKLSIEKQQKLKEESWLSIFSDLNTGPIQATFWELNIESVRSVKKFIAR